MTDFEGMYVKDADKLIVKKLKEMGNLVKESQVKKEIFPSEIAYVNIKMNKSN